MNNRIHLRRLSLVVTFLIAGLGGLKAAQAADSHFYGRWTVSDDKPAYSSKGKLYKTFDVAPCGNDFCGVSVADDGSCGQTLFRFLTVHADMGELAGHGRWGGEKKKLVINYYKADKDPEYFELGLGADDMDLSGREGSMPTFDAKYARDGSAQCMAK